MKVMPAQRPILLSALRACVRVAGVFTAVVTILMIVNVWQARRIDPLNTPRLAALHEQIAKTPADSNLRDEFRALDFLARRAFFSSREFTRHGAYVLLVSAWVMILAAKGVVALTPPVPRPERRPELEAPAGLASRLRGSVAMAGVLILLAAAALMYWTRDVPSLESRFATPIALQVDSPPGPDASGPAWHEIQQQWPGFRGPGGVGVAATSDAPVAWDGASGKGIRWKVEVPLHGLNSPVVWNDAVFLSGAGEERLEVYCFDADSGALRWRYPVRGVPGSPGTWPKVSDDTGYAAPTLATDGTGVFAVFGTGDLVALDLQGKLAWSRHLGAPSNSYGHASSLLTYKGLLYVQYDHAASARLYAYDCRSGNLAWEVERSAKTSWSSPALAVDGDRATLVLAADPWAMAYDAITGAERWRLNCLSGEIAPSPAFADGRVFVVHETPALTAIDLANGEQLWRYEQYPADVPSPVATPELVVMVGSDGAVTCLDARTGQALWVHELDLGGYSSPVLVGTRVFFTDDDGRTTIFKAARTFELIATCELGEPLRGTPAYVGNRIYVRAERHLYCIESPPPES